MELTHSQRGVALGIATAFAITVASFALTALLAPFGVPSDTLALRLHLFALSALAPAIALTICIGRLASHRFFTPQDIDGSGLTAGTDHAKLLQALLQNTLEQLALALPVYAAWTQLAPRHLLALAPVAATLFLFGRLLFFWGYARGAPGRALGFGLTFYPSVLLLAGTLVVTLLR